MKRPFFSIIIPAYNSSNTLKECLNSIVNQTFTNFEVIVQDGNSIDNTVGIIKTYNKDDKRINVYVEADKGIYDAMNRGIQKATGEWLYFLGSDDHLYNNKVLMEVFIMKELNFYDVVYGNVEIVGNNAWAKHGEIYDGKFDTKKLLQKNISHQSIFYKRAFVSIIGGYNTRYKLCADWDYNLRCWASRHFFYVDKIIASFHAGGESTKSKADDNFWNDFLQNVLIYFKINAFNSLVNNPAFADFDKVVALQKKQHYFKYLGLKIKQRLQRSLL